MDYRVWGAMLETYCKLKTKLKTSAKLKEALQVIWGNLPQGPIDKAVEDWKLVLLLGAGAGDEHFEHLQWQWNSGI